MPAVWIASMNCRYELQVWIAGMNCKYELQGWKASMNCNLQVCIASMYCKYELQVRVASINCRFFFNIYKKNLPDSLINEVRGITKCHISTKDKIIKRSVLDLIRVKKKSWNFSSDHFGIKLFLPIDK